MEAVYYAARANLRRLMMEHPDWTCDQLAQATGMSKSWVNKRQHVVETLNIIDKGTSVLVAHHVRSDFTAETALAAVAQTFVEHGLPSSITLDRDTRWVGAPKAVTFPPPWCAFVTAWEPRCSSAIRIIPSKKRGQSIDEGWTDGA